MAEDTGGGSMILRDTIELEDAARVLNMRMRNEYVLGYRPSNGEGDGKWRDIEVRLNRAKDSSSLHIATKSGYYAPVR
jgi:Ca-activated chloride channel family protein